MKAIRIGLILAGSTFFGLCFAQYETATIDGPIPEKTELKERDTTGAVQEREEEAPLERASAGSVDDEPRWYYERQAVEKEVLEDQILDDEITNY